MNSKLKLIYEGKAKKIFAYEDSDKVIIEFKDDATACLLYTSPSPRDATLSRMPSSA